MPVILDIGAGNPYFAQGLVNYNRNNDFLIFCGEPDWKDLVRISFLARVVSKEKAKDLISKEKKGTYRINASYDSFPFDDYALDMVTLNSPHPLNSIIGIEKEVERCTKHGGIFFYGHSTDINIDLSSSFELIAQGQYPTGFRNRTRGYTVNLEKICNDYPLHLPKIFPPSPVIRDNMDVYNKRKEDPSYLKERGISYAFNWINLNPNFKVWMKK
jgi:hypothetical protein